MATRPKHRLTYDDYVRFPDDGRRWELIDGEAFVVPSPDTDHQLALGYLHKRVANHLDEHGGGVVLIAPLDVELAPDQVFQPDLVFVSDSDADVITAKKIKGVPTWIVEVVSDPVRDKRVKLDIYMGSGVPEYWAVDRDLRQVEIYRPGRNMILVEAPGIARPFALPLLEIDLDELFGPRMRRYLP
jgi:Uma2 family endonuclease